MSLPQPDDHGTINGISVLRVTRRGAEADHFTQTPLAPGTEVHVQVDWERRFDHMQQHSGRWGSVGGAIALYGDAPYVRGCHDESDRVWVL